MYQIPNAYQCCFHHTVGIDVQGFLSYKYPSMHHMRRKLNQLYKAMRFDPTSTVEPKELWEPPAPPASTEPQGKKKGKQPAPVNESLPLFSVRPSFLNLRSFELTFLQVRIVEPHHNEKIQRLFENYEHNVHGIESSTRPMEFFISNFVITPITVRLRPLLRSLS